MSNVHASPNIASVTRHFYESGWSGINIEPLPEYAAALRRERPRDQTIEAVAGATRGHCTFHIVEADHDLSTYDPTRVGTLSEHDERTTPVELEMVTLDDVLAAARPEAIDFLKIDVEGAERDVLLGLDLTIWRPRVLVIESTIPNTLTPSYGDWEDLVVSRGFRYASSDGINRYYVADESSSLAPLLGPSNALDSFIPESLRLINIELATLRGYIHHLESEITLKNEHIDAITNQLRSRDGAASEPARLNDGSDNPNR